MIPTPTGWRDHAFGILLAVSYVVLLAQTAGDLAMSRDESVYVVAAERYGLWFEQLFRDPGQALSRKGIDEGWRYNHEHPPLAKTLFAATWLVQEHWDLFATDSLAHRFGGMMTAGLLLWLLYIFGAQAFSRPVGVFAAFAFALLPRVFYHAHLNAFDLPITLAMVFVVYAYWRSLKQVGWAVVAGLGFGLALATKHNSWMLPLLFAVHWLWVAWAARNAARRGEPRRVLRAPWWLVTMATLGPGLFVASWPWLWPEPWPRFQEYAAFHVQHVHYNVAYLGQTWFEPPFPIHVPFVLLVFTVPATTWVLGLCGVALRAPAWLPLARASRIRKEFSLTAEADDRHPEVLLLGLLLAPILAIAWPSSPIFGGTKHWFPAYPALCLFAGIAFEQVGRVVVRQVATLPTADRLPPSAVTVACGALLLSPAVLQTAHSHPFGLSHYTPLAGGVPGAADLGMNRQFWGFTTGTVAEWIRKRLPQGGRIYLGDTTAEAWWMMQRDGLAPKNILPTPDLRRADLAVVHHEDHFLEVELQAWVAYGTVRPAHVLTYDGVPIVSVYENPRRKR